MPQPVAAAATAAAVSEVPLAEEIEFCVLRMQQDFRTPRPVFSYPIACCLPDPETAAFSGNSVALLAHLHPSAGNAGIAAAARQQSKWPTLQSLLPAP